MTEFRLVAFRMSADVPAMIDFLTVLGLREQVRADRTVDGKTPYATAHGRLGKVAVHLAHDAESVGRTELTFDVDDGDAVVGLLTDARIAYRRHDEAFGRVVTALTPAGDVWIGEDNRDAHGYSVSDTSDYGPIDVEAVRFTDEPAAERELWSIFGYDGDEELVGPDGVILLHDGDRPARDSRIALTFRTDTDLDELAARLVAAGYADAAVRDEDGIRVLYVTDPDGQETQVWPA